MFYNNPLSEFSIEYFFSPQSELSLELTEYKKEYFQSFHQSAQSFSKYRQPGNNQKDKIKDESTNPTCKEENMYSKILEYYYLLKKNKTNGENKKEHIEIPNQIRIESGIKHCTVILLKFIRDIANTFIQNSTIKKKLKKKIFRANTKLFTGKISESASSSSFNYSFLEIFSKGKEQYKKQKLNFENINNISKEIKKYENKNEKIEENIKMLKTILEMNYKDLINLFLESEEFENFIKDPKTEIFNKEFLRQGQPSFCKKEDFFKHFSGERKKRNKHIFKIKSYSNKSNKIFPLKKIDKNSIEKLFIKAFKEDSLTEVAKTLTFIANNEIEEKNTV